MKLHHNLDVMHIEKNVCENTFNWLLEKDGKLKDTKARLDISDWGIRKSLLPKKSKKQEKHIFPMHPTT